MDLSDCTECGIGLVFHLFVLNKAEQPSAKTEQIAGKVLAQFWPPEAQGWAGNFVFTAGMSPTCSFTKEVCLDQRSGLFFCCLVPLVDTKRS